MTARFIPIGFEACNNKPRGHRPRLHRNSFANHCYRTLGRDSFLRADRLSPRRSEQRDLLFLLDHLLFQFIGDLPENFHCILSLSPGAGTPRLLVRALVSQLEFETSASRPEHPTPRAPSRPVAW